MIKTRATERLGIHHPIVSAPMNLAAGGRLAAAVTSAGGFGLIGGGYGDATWLDTAFREAGNARVGCGFITWALAEQPELLGQVLEHNPKAICLSFGDPMPFVDQIRAAGSMLICQVTDISSARQALDVNADIIVAQGAEAGGHGERRATFTLVPELADLLADAGSDALLLAAGGVGDGRGLAASLMLGADGVLMGSRLWASAEADVHPNMLKAAVDADGDATLRSSVMDIVRYKNWPDGFTARVLKNAFTDRWHDDQEALRSNVAEHDRWAKAWGAGDTDVANTFVGEVTGLIHDIRPAADIIEDTVAEAEKLLQRGTDWQNR